MSIRYMVGRYIGNQRVSKNARKTSEEHCREYKNNNKNNKILQAFTMNWVDKTPHHTVAPTPTSIYYGLNEKSHR